MAGLTENGSQLTDELSNRLQRQIVQGLIRPGAKLQSQRDMATTYRVSRATVREAIAQLQHVGLVETRHGGGSYCNNLLTPFFQPADDSMVVGRSLAVQVLEMREAMESEAAYYCAMRASDEELSLLRQEYAQMVQRNSGANTLRQAKSDLKFHMMIAENSHHLLVLSISQILYTRYFNAIHSVLSQTFKKKGRYPELIGTQHRRIYQAIMARDPHAARAAASAHIAYTRGLLLS